jgi:hypothetical protein
MFTGKFTNLPRTQICKYYSDEFFSCASMLAAKTCIVHLFLKQSITWIQQIIVARKLPDMARKRIWVKIENPETK